MLYVLASRHTGSIRTSMQLPVLLCNCACATLRLHDRAFAPQQVYAGQLSMQAQAKLPPATRIECVSLLA